MIRTPNPIPVAAVVSNVDTGVSIEIPNGYWGKILDRSGNALKKGLSVMGGVIDAPYRGDVGIILINLSTVWHEGQMVGQPAIEIKKGDKIAQIVILPYKHLDVVEVDELRDSSRGSKGYGSSDAVK